MKMETHVCCKLCRLCMRHAAQLMLLSLAFLISSVKAEIRCYCNQPTCVSTGYMCKSNADVCFTKLLSYTADLSKSHHGCIELLKPEKRVQCRIPSSKVLSLPVIYCCKEDMCNYMNTMDFNVHVNMKANVTKYSGSVDLSEERRALEAALQQDIWLKAAVIAVPIAGGCILVLLILLASRMLRQDSKRQRQLLELRRQQTLFSKPHFCVAQPCVNHSNYSASHSSPNCKQNYSYGNVNLSMSRDSWYTDSSAADRLFVYDKSLSNRNSMCAALLPWAKWNHSKLSTHV